MRVRLVCQLSAISGLMHRNMIGAMVDDRPIRRAKMREKFAELKRAAIADLERRGYDVRGKTPAQIRLILKRRPSKQTSDAKGALKEPPRSGHGASDVIT
jgi:hypothetical protein